MNIKDFPEPRTAPQRTKIMEIYRSLMADLESEDSTIKNRLAVMPGTACQSPSDYNPDRHYYEGKSVAISHALRLVNDRFRHIHVRHATDNRKCRECGQDLMHEVHKRMV